MECDLFLNAWQKSIHVTSRFGLTLLELSNYAYQNTDKDTEGNFKME